MTNVASFKPDATAGDKSAAMSRPEVIGDLALGDKRAVAALAGGMSTRWVDGQLTKGMPHLRFGSRRVRFDLAEVRAWLKDCYGTRRRGRLHPAAEAQAPEAADV